MSKLKPPYKEPFTVQYKGDSMYPTLEDGDCLLGDAAYPIENYAIVIVEFGDGKQTCGRLFIDGDQKLLTFDNPMYKPIDITQSEKTDVILGSYRCLGRIVKISRDP